ncbi:hypothetical protein R6Q57_025798 [Mikania cordata]
MCARRVSEIKPADAPQPIEIRVIKKWKPFVKRDERPAEICYLFVDAESYAIEATTDISIEGYLDSIIEIQQSYVVDKYVSISARTYMPTVPHQASLKIGKRATFAPLHQTTIPSYYYNFATYDDLDARRRPPKLLKDYIGRVEDVSSIIVRARKTLRKITIQDERFNELDLPSNIQTSEKHVMLATLLSEDTAEGRYTCIATIEDIHEYRGWYFVLCPECKNKAYPQGNNFACVDHEIIGDPLFMQA